MAQPGSGRVLGRRMGGHQHRVRPDQELRELMGTKVMSTMPNPWSQLR